MLKFDCRDINHHEVHYDFEDLLNSSMKRFYEVKCCWDRVGLDTFLRVTDFCNVDDDLDLNIIFEV